MIEQIKLLTQQAIDGDVNELQAYIELKRAEKVIADAISKVQDAAFERAETYGDKTFEAFGADVTIKNGATRYKFDHIKEWSEKKAEIKDIEEQAKLAAKLVANRKIGVSADTGEITTPAEVIPGKATLSISLKE